MGEGGGPRYSVVLGEGMFRKESRLPTGKKKAPLEDDGPKKRYPSNLIIELKFPYT